MAFNLPTLHNFIPSDNDYVQQINTNFDQIYTSFSGALADVNNVLSLTGTSVAADFYKKRGGDPTGVILGPYSYVLSYSDPILSLKPGTELTDPTSTVYIGGVRKKTIGVAGLTFDVSTLSWNLQEIKILSVGLNSVIGSDTEVEMAVDSASGTGAPGLQLYTVEIQFKDPNYFLNRVKTRRRTGSMTWDNTLEQKRQETKRVVRVSTSLPSGQVSGDGPMYIPFTIPYDHIFESCDCYVHKGAVSTEIGVIVRDAGTTSTFTPPAPGVLSGGIFAGTDAAGSSSNPKIIADTSDDEKILKVALTAWDQSSSEGPLGIIKGDSTIYYAEVSVTTGNIKSAMLEFRLTEVHGLDDPSVVYS